MSDPFDPYYTGWGFGLRNNRRIIIACSLQLFEDHLEAIDMRPTARWHSHVSTGQYAELSLRLLDEVAAAKRCLLEPERKAAYDAMLWEQLDDQTPTVPSAVPKGGSANTPQAAILIEKKRPRWGPSRRRSWPVSSILVAAAAVAGVVLGGLWWPWQVWPESSEAVVVVSPEIVVPQSAGRPNPTVSSSDAAGTLPRDQWTDLLVGRPGPDGLCQEPT